MPFRDWQVVRVLEQVAFKVWACTGCALLAFYIVYCFYGGLPAFMLFMIAISGVLYQIQDNLLYHPDSPPNSRIFIPVPSTYGLPFESVKIKTSDNINLHAFWVRHPGSLGDQVPTLIYFHGNAGNMGHRLKNVEDIFKSLHCNVLMVEYRGYGLSTGVPSEEGFYLDARASLEFLLFRRDLDHSQIFLFGRSLGGAVAINLAADFEYGPKVAGLIVENTFTSIPDMAAAIIHPYFLQLPTWFYRNKFNSINKIQFVAKPTLFISGLKDTLVPPNMMSKLHSRCASMRRVLCQIREGTHNYTWATSGYYNNLDNFIKVITKVNSHLSSFENSHKYVPPSWTLNGSANVPSSVGNLINIPRTEQHQF